MAIDKRLKNRSRWSRVLILLLLIIILVPIVIFVTLYYLPLNDVQVTVEGSYPNSEIEYDHYEIVIMVNVTNNGIISHHVYLTGEVVFSVEPNMTYCETYRSLGPIDAGPTYSKIRIRVPVPEELFQDPYDVTCHVTLPPAINKYNTDMIVIFTVVWLVLIAAVSVALVRSRRGE